MNERGISKKDLEIIKSCAQENDWDKHVNLTKLIELIRDDEREAFPNLEPVITWLESGCDPKEAAKELRIYADAIRARGEA